MPFRSLSTLFVIATVLLLAGPAAADGPSEAPLADLRPAHITVAPQPEREAQGRAMMQAALEAHGGAQAFQAPGVLSFDVVDHWQGPAAAQSPWPSATAEARVVLRPHSFDSNVTFTSGPREGDIWGFTGGAGWERSGDDATTASDNPRLSFILPTLHYFVELPIRATEAERYRYVGTEEIDDITYDVVFFTWGSVEANPDYDQFLAYISPTTGRIAKVQFTVRDTAPHATGVAHLLDMTQAGDAWLPSRLPITPTLHSDLQGYMHEFRFHGFAYGPGAVQTWP